MALVPAVQPPGAVKALNLVSGSARYRGNSGPHITEHLISVTQLFSETTRGPSVHRLDLGEV